MNSVKKTIGNIKKYKKKFVNGSRPFGAEKRAVAARNPLQDAVQSENSTRRNPVVRSHSVHCVRTPTGGHYGRRRARVVSWWVESRHFLARAGVATPRRTHDADDTKHARGAAASRTFFFSVPCRSLPLSKRDNTSEIIIIIYLPPPAEIPPLYATRRHS